jgi:hypothetical protein
MLTAPRTTSDPTAGGPGDIPASRPAWLDRFDALLGTWEMEATFGAGYFASDAPAIVNRDGRTTFEWLDGRFFLVQRFANDHPAAPSGIAIIAPDEGVDVCLQHYFDSRGVARVYRTTLQDRTWTVWREALGFWQRYTGVISDDGDRIVGAWEGSADGSQWKHDFDLTYIRTRSAR